MPQSIFPRQAGSGAHRGKTGGPVGSHIFLAEKNEGLARTSLANKATVETRSSQTVRAQLLHIWRGVSDKDTLSGFCAMTSGRNRTPGPARLSLLKEQSCSLNAPNLEDLTIIRRNFVIKGEHFFV